MDTAILIFESLGFLVAGYLYFVYMRRMVIGEPIAERDDGKLMWVLDVTIVALVFLNVYLDILIESLEAIIKLIGA